MRINDMCTLCQFVPEELADVIKEDGALYLKAETAWNQYVRALVLARWGCVPTKPWRLCSPGLRHVDEHGHETLCINCTSPDVSTAAKCGLTMHIHRVLRALTLVHGP